MPTFSKPAAVRPADSKTPRIGASVIRVAGEIRRPSGRGSRQRRTCCAGLGCEDFRVSEIWDSREQFDAFGERLMPVLKDVGIEFSGEPEVLEIHNIIKR